MTPDIEKIEHLLNAKTFEELSSSERQLVLAHLSGKAEYDHMRETLLRVKKVFNTEAQAMAVDTVLKEQVLNRFEQNKQQSVSVFGQIAVFFQTLIPTPMGRFSAALAVLLVVVTIGYFSLPNTKPEMAQNTPATKIKQHEAVAEGDSGESLSIETVESKEEEATLGNSHDAPSGKGATFAPVTTEIFKAEEEVASYRADEKTKEANVLKQMPVMAEKNMESDQNRMNDKPRTYTNSDGYEQYNITNNRSASLPQKESSDVMKDYSAKNKKTTERKENHPAPAEGALSGKADDNKSTQKIDNVNVAAANVQQETVSKTEATKTYKIPAWSGYENANDANYLTGEKIKYFLLQELNIITLEKLKGHQVKFLLTFNENGNITLGKVLHFSKGKLPDAYKAEIESKMLKLPPFKFSSNGGQKTLEQTYSITF